MSLPASMAVMSQGTMRMVITKMILTSSTKGVEGTLESETAPFRAAALAAGTALLVSPEQMLPEISARKAACFTTMTKYELKSPFLTIKG